MGMRRASPDAVLDAALPLARQLLAWFGGFHPWAIALRLDGVIDSVFPDFSRMADASGMADCDENADGAPLIELLREQAGLLAASEDLAAVAIVYDALVRDPHSDALQDAIAMEIAIGPRLERQRLVTVPYVRDSGAVRFGPAHASAWFEGGIEGGGA